MVFSKSPFNPKEIQRMMPRHFQMLDLKVAGLPNKQIAAAVGCSTSSVDIVARSPLFRAELNRRLNNRNKDAVVQEIEAFAGKARSILEQSSEKAAETSVDLLDSPDDSIRHRASVSILDRVLGKTEAGVSAGPTINVQINESHAQLLVLALKESSDGQGKESSPDSTPAGAPQD